MDETLSTCVLAGAALPGVGITLVQFHGWDWQQLSGLSLQLSDIPAPCSSAGSQGLL